MTPVICVMLTRDRTAMARRAIECFRAQKYQAKQLLVLCSAPERPAYELPPSRNEVWLWRPDLDGQTIGALRNAANYLATAALIAHWDDDDWSHAQRLAEQVALLEASGKQCVGYREVLFWDTRESPSEAWIYRNPDLRWAAGASMLYRRELWERQHFGDHPHEDQRWWLTPLVSANCIGTADPEQRMICQMHAGGTEQIPRAVMLKGDVWRRASEWDEHCERIMRCA